MKRWVFIGILLVPLSGIAYRRLTYVQHNFKLPVQDTSTLLEEIAQNNAARNKKSAAYTLRSTDSRQDVVYLSRLDKWRISRTLRTYTTDTVLTVPLIQQIITPLWGKRRTIVQHVLEDLTKQQQVTVGQVLRMLN